MPQAFTTLDQIVQALGFTILGAMLFYFSVYYFLLLAVLVPIGLVVVIVGEIRHAFPRRSWLEFLCFCWLFLMTPTFGLMPVLIASRLHWELPEGNELGIYTGFTLSAVYDFFIPTPELPSVDHPFPPITKAQAYLLGLITFTLSTLSIYGIVKLHRMRAKSASPVESN